MCYLLAFHESFSKFSVYFSLFVWYGKVRKKLIKGRLFYDECSQANRRAHLRRRRARYERSHPRGRPLGHLPRHRLRRHPARIQWTHQRRFCPSRRKQRQPHYKPRRHNALYGKKRRVPHRRGSTARSGHVQAPGPRRHCRHRRRRHVPRPQGVFQAGHQRCRRTCNHRQ